MPDQNAINPQTIMDNSSLVTSQQEVEAAVIQMGNEVNDFYQNKSIIMLVVMTGGIMPAAWLAGRVMSQELAW